MFPEGLAALQAFTMSIAGNPGSRSHQHQGVARYAERRSGQGAGASPRPAMYHIEATSRHDHNNPAVRCQVPARSALCSVYPYC